MGASDASSTDSARERLRYRSTDADVPIGFGLGDHGRHLFEFADQVPLAILALDARGGVIYANPALADLVGSRSAELVGVDGLALLLGPEQSSRDDRYAELLAGGSSYFETEVTSANGRVRTLGWHAVPVHSDHGVAVGSLSIGADLTARLLSTAARDAVDAIERAMLQGRPGNELERRVCESARDIAGSAFAVLARPGRRGCEVCAVAGLPAEAFLGQAAPAPWCSSGATHAEPIVAEGPELLGPLGEALGSAAMVPLAAPPSCGFLLVAGHPGAPPIEEYVVDVIKDFARQVNIALEYGSRVRELAVLEDRERIAQDLHDLVIQRIFAAGLSLQVAAQMSTEPQLAGRLSEVSGVLDGAIAELRRSILGLEAPDERLLGRRVEQVVVEVTDGADLDVVVEVPEGSAGISETLIGHSLAALREALTNVVRHAGADKVEVVVAIDDSLVLSVRDDGRGLASTDPGDGHGLTNLADRARHLGGAFHVEDAPGGGVALEWRVPLLRLPPD